MQCLRMQGDLRMVAYLFILHGGYAILKILVGLLRDDIRIDLGVLCFLAGFGLLRLSTGWWRFAQIYNLLYLMVTPIVTLMIANANSPLTARIMKMPMGEVSKEFAILLCGMGWLVTLWEYLVLTRINTRELFVPSGRPSWENPKGRTFKGLDSALRGGDGSQAE